MRIWDYPQSERGGGDDDRAYRFGQAISTDQHGLFSLQEFARLMLVRARQSERHLLRLRTGKPREEAA